MRLRKQLQTILTAVSYRIDKPLLRAAAEELEMWDEDDRPGPVNFAQLNALVDFAAFSMRRKGGTVIEEFVDRSRPKFGSETEQIMDGLRAARYSIFEIAGFLPECGVRFRDVFRGDEIDVLDVALSQTAEGGVFLAVRVIPVPGFWMSLGAFLLCSEAMVDELLSNPPPWSKATPAETFSAMSPSEEAEFVSTIISLALDEGGDLSARSAKLRESLELLE